MAARARPLFFSSCRWPGNFFATHVTMAGACLVMSMQPEKDP